MCFSFFVCVWLFACLDLSLCHNKIQIKVRNEILNLLFLFRVLLFRFKLHQNKQKPRTAIWFYFMCECDGSGGVCVRGSSASMCTSVSGVHHIIFPFFSEQKFCKMYGNPLKSVCDDKWNGKKIEETWAHLPSAVLHKARWRCRCRFVCEGETKGQNHCQDKMFDCIELRKVRAAPMGEGVSQRTNQPANVYIYRVCVWPMAKVFRNFLTGWIIFGRTTRPCCPCLCHAIQFIEMGAMQMLRRDVEPVEHIAGWLGGRGGMG